MAEAATSSFEKSPLSSSSATYGHLQPFLKQSKQLGQQQSLPKSYQGLLQPASLLPSIEDLNTLESTLFRLEGQLKTLYISKAKDPLNAPTLSKAITDVENSISTLKKDIQTLKNDLQALKKAENSLSNALLALFSAQASLTTAQSTHSTASNTLLTSKEARSNQQLITDTAKNSLDQSQAIYDQSLIKKGLSDASLTQQQEASAQALQTLNERQAQTITSAESLAQAQATYNQAQQALEEAQSAYEEAQHNYDTNLIPDPDWTPPTYQKENTRLVPYTDIQIVRTLVPTTTTTFQEQVIPNLLPNPTLTSTEGWSGVYPGWQGSQPGMYDGEITFSYMYQTVTQGLYSGPFENATLTLSADWYSDWTADSYSMTVTAEDINRNPVGTATYTNTRTGHDWTNRSVTLEATGPVSYITISFSGIDHGFWYGMYGPRMKNPALEVSYGQYVTETTYEEVITYEEVTKYREEIYYTTETIQPQQGLTVRVYNQLPTSNPLRSDTAYNLCKTTTLTSINHQWGGGDILGCGSDRVMLHYTGYITPTENITSLRGLADDGFYLDINGVNAINNWTLKGCSGNWNPVNLQAGQSYAIDAWFYEWGGGACSILNYQSANGEGVVPEAWYSNGASAPLIKDPALLPALQQSQSLLLESQQSLGVAQQTLNEAQANDQETTSQLQTAQQNYNAEAAKSQELQTLNEALSLEVASNKTNLDIYSQNHEKELNNLSIVITNETLAITALEDATSKLTTAEKNLEEATLQEATAKNEYSSVQTSNEASFEVATSSSSQVQPLIDAANEILNKEPAPLPEPEPEPEGSTEIPAVIENLMDVDLNAVDPTELTEEQAGQLVEAALVAFETAEEGSPEYEQALDALFLAAEQDDIELPEELAAIPGLAGAVEVLNFLGNAGADMSPKVREESEKVVVATVIAAGAAIQAATGAATSAAVSAGASTGSGGSRRIGK